PVENQEFIIVIIRKNADTDTHIRSKRRRFQDRPLFSCHKGKGKYTVFMSQVTLPNRYLYIFSPGNSIAIPNRRQEAFISHLDLAGDNPCVVHAVGTH